MNADLIDNDDLKDGGGAMLLIGANVLGVFMKAKSGDHHRDG